MRSRGLAAACPRSKSQYLALFHRLDGNVQVRRITVDPLDGKPDDLPVTQLRRFDDDVGERTKLRATLPIGRKSQFQRLPLVFWQALRLGEIGACTVSAKAPLNVFLQSQPAATSALWILSTTSPRLFHIFRRRSMGSYRPQEAT